MDNPLGHTIDFSIKSANFKHQLETMTTIPVQEVGIQHPTFHDGTYMLYSNKGRMYSFLTYFLVFENFLKNLFITKFCVVFEQYMSSIYLPIVSIQ